MEKLSEQIAQTILDGFERHFNLFQEITAKAKVCFEQSQWKKIQEMNKERIFSLHKSKQVRLNKGLLLVLY
jgi:isocitrate dehydrogenase kinase/phosphatase